MKLTVLLCLAVAVWDTFGESRLVAGRIAQTETFCAAAVTTARVKLASVRIIKGAMAADRYLAEAPVTVTAASSPRSAGRMRKT
jgi:hypothetical protein